MENKVELKSDLDFEGSTLTDTISLFEKVDIISMNETHFSYKGYIKIESKDFRGR